MKNFLTLFVFPVFLFCSFFKVNFREQNRSEKQLHSTGTNQITYLFFKAEKNNSGLDKITLQDKKITEGKLKSAPSFDRNSVHAGDYIVSLTDANGKEITKQIVEDPLNPVMEVYGDNISRHKISLERAEFSIRYSQSAEITMVKIEKITESGTQLLFNQKL